jgi:hypothetical protein
MKYIVLNINDIKNTFIFPSKMTDKTMVETISLMRDYTKDSIKGPMLDAECVSAGFINTHGECSGRS